MDEEWPLPSAPDGWMYWRRDGRWVAMPLSGGQRRAASRGLTGHLPVHHVQVGAMYDLESLVYERMLVLPDWPVQRGQA
jgi:hypothetical protein